MHPDARQMMKPPTIQKEDMLTSTHVLARVQAGAAIRSYLSTITVDGESWYDLSTVDAEEVDAEPLVEHAERYLDAGGLLVRHPERTNLVRMHPDVDAPASMMGGAGRPRAIPSGEAG